MPSLAEIKDFEQINPDLFEELEKEVKVQVDNAATDSSEAAKQRSDTEQVAMTDVNDGLSEDAADAKHNVVSDEDNVVPFG